MRQTKPLGIFPGLQCTENADIHPQGYKTHEATPRVSVLRSHWQMHVWWEKEKKKEENLKSGRKIITQNKKHRETRGRAL